MKNRVFALLIMLVLLVSACASMGSNVVRSEKVTSHASVDLDCPEDKVVVEQVSNTTWKVSGCEKSAMYTCWTSVGMGDGTCMRDQ